MHGPSEVKRSVIRIGISGVGAWGRNLLRNVVAGENTALVAVCDPDSGAMRPVAANHDVKLYTGFSELIEDTGLDAIIIASPPALHYEQARLAIEAGLDVMVEKPMCMTGAEAQKLVALAADRQRVLMVGHTFLYSNLVHEVKRRIDSGELGHVLYMYGQRLNLGRVRRDVDALWNLAPHDISITSYLFDAWPESVSARGSSFIQKQDAIADVAFFQMDFERDRIMSGHVSWLDPQKVRKMVVVGSEKMLVYDDLDSQRHVQIYDKSVAVEFQSGTQDFCDFRTRTRAGDLVVPQIGLVEPLGVEVAHFADCVRDRTTPRTDGIHAMWVINVLEAMSQSMREAGANVPVEYGEVAEATAVAMHA